MISKSLSLLLSLAAAAPMLAQAPERIDTDMNAKLRNEEAERSKIMWIEHILTDVYGPRPVGSPNHVAAANWAVKTMTEWGMKNAHLEPFVWHGETGVGWLPGLAMGHLLTPVKSNLKFEAVPWSPSITGTLKGEIVVIIPPTNPTEAEFQKYLVALAPRVKGGMVMFGAPQNAGVNFNERSKRTDDSSAKARYNAPPGAAGGRGGGRQGGGGGPPAAGGRGAGGRAGGAAAPVDPTHVSSADVTNRINTLLRDNMPGLRIVSAGNGRIPGDIIAQNGSGGGGGQIYDNVTPQPPSIILRQDDYGRIWRIANDGTPVTAEFSMTNTYYPEGKTSYVTVAEIPGTDKADEVVMMGGHLDSWTSATGATDNAIGCAIMMEAARLLITQNAHPRRTIRVALWSGEEEGELGSFAYVANHFGSAENPKPDFNKLVAYWNIDDGTGRVRGASIFGPPEASRILGQYIKPFEDWGMYGAVSTNARAEGGSDNGAFAVAGLPGVGTQQDNIEYNSVTWHTNLDTYERIVPEDVMHNAVLSAAVMWGLANREENLPRFAKDQMPAPQGGGGGAAGRAGRGGADSAAAPVAPTAASHIYVVAKAKPFTKAAGALGVAAAGGRGGGGGGRAGGANATTAAVAAKPAHGTLVLGTNGGFTYTPAVAFVGTDTFTYTVTRGGLKSEPVSVTLIVK